MMANYILECISEYSGLRELRLSTYYDSVSVEIVSPGTREHIFQQATLMQGKQIQICPDMRETLASVVAVSVPRDERCHGGDVTA
jgi:hypothetical protein